LLFLRYISNPATWTNLKKCSQALDIGQKIVSVMQNIEKQNPDFHKIFPMDYFSLHLNHCNFGAIIELIDSLPIHTDTDLLGNIYEYFLGKFALAEGRKSGQFYTPPCIVKLLVEMLEPFQGSVYDPCCGSGSMFVQSEKFTMAHQGSPDDITIYGQESNATTHRLCRMNLAIRGIDASNIKWNHEGSFLNVAHPHLKADYILANPPFNDSDWDGGNGSQLKNDPRWQYGVPPRYNANFAWLQHILSHLSPRGCAGVVLSNGSLSTQRPAESTIRKNMVEQGVIDCIVGLPDRLFYNTGISACLWFLKQRKKNKAGKNEILFIDARSLGHMINRRNRELSEQDIHTIAELYHEWIGNDNDNERNYLNIPGLCKSVPIEEIRRQQYFLTPTRYVSVGTSKIILTDAASFEKTMAELSEEFQILMKEGAELDRIILDTIKNGILFED
jgi:type I restriction enzyme M protein